MRLEEFPSFRKLKSCTFRRGPQFGRQEYRERPHEVPKMVISRPIRIPSVGDDDYVAGQKTRAKTHRVEYDCFDVVCFERGAKDGSELVANNKSQADFVTDILRATPRAAPFSSGPTGAPPCNPTQGFRTSRSGHAIVSGRSTIRSCNLANCGERKLSITENI